MPIPPTPPYKTAGALNHTGTVWALRRVTGARPLIPLLDGHDTKRNCAKLMTQAKADGDAKTIG